MGDAGNGDTIKHAMSGVNPEGRRVWSFKKPSDEGLDNTFLWRDMLPAARCPTARRALRSTKYPTECCARFAFTRFSLDYPQGAH